MNAEEAIFMLMQAAIFTSILTLGFKATDYKPFALFRRPSLLIRTFLSMYVVVPVVTAVILSMVPLPLGVKTGVILGDFTGCDNRTTQHAGSRSAPGLRSFPIDVYDADICGYGSNFPGHSDGSSTSA